MRFVIPPEYSDPAEVPPEFLGPGGVPTLGWLAERATTIRLEPEEHYILSQAAYGVPVSETAEQMDLSHDRVEVRRADVTSLLLGTSILHAARIGLEVGMVAYDKPKPGSPIPVVQGENVETYDLLSRGYKTEEVAALQGIRKATVHSRMKLVYAALKKRGILPTTTAGYRSGLLRPLSPQERLPHNDPILALFM